MEMNIRFIFDYSLMHMWKLYSGNTTGRLGFIKKFVSHLLMTKKSESQEG